MMGNPLEYTLLARHDEDHGDFSWQVFGPVGMGSFALYGASGYAYSLEECVELAQEVLNEKSLEHFGASWYSKEAYITIHQV
jgi:hypothetical protein